MINYLSVCSGVEAASVAWKDLSWKPVGFSEIEPFPSAVLKTHYPEVVNYGDMTKYKEWNINESVNLIVGGTPCQSFSIAGLRKGLEDERGNLALIYCQMLAKYKPKWFIWENVPGVLSSSRGRDFASFLGAVAELGYGFAYRVLDAQYFGVAQRRRRVFVVGCLGDWESPREVLFESESLCRDNQKSKGKRKSPASYVGRSTTASGKDTFGTLMANAGSKQWLGNQEAFTGDYHILETKVYENHGTDSRIKEVSVSPTVTARWGTGGNNVPLAHTTTKVVRRLSPVETERLQGFPDNYTNIMWRNKDNAPDSLRYKSMGNSMAVPVMRWIGERINNINKDLK